jgi:hypothetical protein
MEGPMEKAEELLKRADVLLKTFSEATGTEENSEAGILRESVKILKRAIELNLSNGERKNIQRVISWNLRKIIELTKETDELFESAIKLEVMLKELSNPPAQN